MKQAVWTNLRAGRAGLPAALLLAALLSACASHPPAPVIERGGAGVAANATPPVVASPVPAPLPPAIAAGVADGTIHLVKKGETLYRIATDAKLSPKDVAAWNNLADPNKLETDQPIRLTPPDGVVVKPIAPAAPVESRPTAGAATAPAAAAVAQQGAKGNAETFKREPKAGKKPYSEQAWAQIQGTAPLTAAAADGAKPVSKPADKPVDKPADKPADKAADKSDAKAGGGVEWAWPSSGKVLKSYSANGNKGVDIDGKVGDPVLAAAAGKVIYAGNYPHYGKLLIVKHNGAILSAYAHNNQILVKEGQAVSKGQKIAELGKSDADAPKLHFEVRSQGKPVDPMKYLPNRE